MKYEAMWRNRLIALKIACIKGASIYGQTGTLRKLSESSRAWCRHAVYTWLVDVLQRVSTHPARDVAQLTPRLWKDHFADTAMTSDVSRAVTAKAPQAA